MTLQIKCTTNTKKINIIDTELKALNKRIDEIDRMNKANGMQEVSREARQIRLNEKQGGSSRGEKYLGRKAHGLGNINSPSISRESSSTHARLRHTGLHSGLPCQLRGKICPGGLLRERQVAEDKNSNKENARVPQNHADKDRHTRHVI